MNSLEPHYAGIPHDERQRVVRYPIHVVADNLRSAYNVGSLFRTSDAAGVTHLHLCGMSAHPPHKKIEKTSLGAFEYVPWTYYERTTDAIQALKDQGIPVVAIETADNAVSHVAYDWPQPVAIVFGNEVNGINDRVISRCDAVVNIPMHGYKNSINVATAFGIILYEILRRWQAIP